MVLTPNQLSPDTEALPREPRGVHEWEYGGREGGGNHSLFIFFMWLSLLLRSYQAPSSVVV